MPEQITLETPVQVHKRGLAHCASCIGRVNDRPFEGRAAGDLEYLGFIGLGGDAGYSGGVFTGHHRFADCKGSSGESMDFGTLPAAPEQIESESEVDNGVHT